MAPEERPSAFWTTARRLGVDAATAEVVVALEKAGVGSILLRGLAVRRRLYGDRDRAYGDVDLLVPPEQFDQAEAVLADVGFREVIGERDSFEPAPHADTWVRGTTCVDLHRTLRGAGTTPAETWSTLSAESEATDVAGTTVQIPNAPALAVVLALHAAQHGAETSKPIGDLERAVQQFDVDVWTTAATLANRLGATAAFAAGLRLVPEGPGIAERLDLPEQRSTELALAASSAPGLAVALQRVAAAPRAREKLAIVFRQLVPTPAYMRLFWPIARRGLPGLCAAYVWRAAVAAATAPAALRAWRAARNGRA